MDRSARPAGSGGSPSVDTTRSAPRNVAALSSSVRSALDVSALATTYVPDASAMATTSVTVTAGRAPPAHARAGRSQSPAGERARRRPKASGPAAAAGAATARSGKAWASRSPPLGLAADEADAARPVEAKVGRDRDGDHGDEGRRTRRRAVTLRGGCRRCGWPRPPTTPTTSTATARRPGWRRGRRGGRLQLRRRADRDDGEHRHRRADRRADEDGRERGHAERPASRVGPTPRRHAAEVAPAFRAIRTRPREQRAGRREPGQADGRHGPAHHLREASAYPSRARPEV